MSLDTEFHEVWDFFTLVDDTHHYLLTVYCWECRDTQVEGFVVDHCRETTILRDTCLIDLQIRHDLESGDYLLVEKRLILEDLSEFTINAITKADDVREGFDMDI